MQIGSITHLWYIFCAKEFGASISLSQDDYNRLTLLSQPMTQPDKTPDAIIGTPAPFEEDLVQKSAFLP